MILILLDSGQSYIMQGLSPRVEMFLFWLGIEIDPSTNPKKQP